MSNQRQSKNNGFASATEVARLAGVSRSAVSRTFTPGRSVSDETRSKVIAAAEVLNYHVNHLARGLSKEASRPVCILGGNLSSPYQSRLLEHLTLRLHKAGRAVMVINTDDGEANAKEALQKTLNYRSTATIVLSGKPPVSLIERCLQSGQQVILINRLGQFPHAENIDLDYSSTMKEALHHLISAGCQRLAMISSVARSPSMVIRETRFLEAAAEAGTEVQVIRPGNTSYQTGAAAARVLLNQSKRPDGLFCVTDLIACGFMDAARHEFGLQIPDDICVIGFDDIEQASWLSYQLTTFSQPLAEMAEAACQRLLSPCADNLNNQLFTASLVRRATLR